MIGDLEVDADVDMLTWAESAARRLAAEVEFASCTGHGAAWSELEVRHHRAPNGWAGRALVQQMRDDFCTGCPGLLWCARWAKETGYTGLAAGFPYVRGERQESTWVLREAEADRRAPRGSA